MLGQFSSSDALSVQNLLMLIIVGVNFCLLVYQTRMLHKHDERLALAVGEQTTLYVTIKANEAINKQKVADLDARLDRLERNMVASMTPSAVNSEDSGGQGDGG